MCNPKTHYVVKADRGWWDGYKGQSTRIINYFRGHVPYDKLLQVIDMRPGNVRRNGQEPTPFLAKHMIITSRLHPQDVYHNRDKADSRAQLHKTIKTKFRILRIIITR